MNKQEVFALIRRNKNTRKEAIKLIADFLVIDKNRATKIYEREFENNEKQSRSEK
jgi:hypothetical protein